MCCFRRGEEAECWSSCEQYSPRLLPPGTTFLPLYILRKFLLSFLSSSVMDPSGGQKLPRKYKTVDRHVDSTCRSYPSFTLVGKLYNIFSLFFTVMLVYNVLLFSSVAKCVMILNIFAIILKFSSKKKKIYVLGRN
jgi:hypothetical protein